MKAEFARVTAVHERDTNALLDLLGVGEGYRSGTLRCVVCGTPLRESGLGAASRGTNGVVFACDRIDCLEGFNAT